MIKGEANRILALCREHGATNVLSWYRMAADRRVSQWQAIKYVYGIIRKIKGGSGA
jgi:hypothetical protein